MKIFISHSSKDKWAARRIAKDLDALGCSVFIDEKDIKTGESIDAAIRTNLVDCDHFLILISPASLGSEWVLLELGGAIALSKTVIPILLYVGVNEVPQAINLKLARDINELDRYYDEIISIVKKRPMAMELPSEEKRIDSKFQKGAIVRIATNSPEKIYRAIGFDTAWSNEMDKFLGHEARIVEVDEDGDYSLDIDEGKFFWAKEWLVRSSKS